jgi:putative DNA primase/helicase
MTTKGKASGAGKAPKAKGEKSSSGSNSGAQGKPQAQNGDLRNLPKALAPLVALPHWVLWRYEKKGDDWTKVPYQPNNKKAASDNPATWFSYGDVIIHVDKFDGIGFCLLNSGFGAFDIDKCRSSAIHPWANDLVTRVGSYTEISPSGTGLRIIGYSTIQKKGRKQPVVDGVSLETYAQGKRYITITGNPLPDAPQQLVNIEKVIDEVVAELDANKKQKKKSGTSDKSELPADLRRMLHFEDHGAGAATGGYPTRSELFFAFINEALRKGIDENRIVEVTLDPAYAGYAIYAHVVDNGGEDYVKRQIEQAANVYTDDKGRTFIQVVGGKLDETWRATQQALIAHNCPIYVRGGRLVEPQWRWEKSSDDEQRQVLTARFKSYNLSRLMDVTAHRAVQFQKYDGRSRKLNDIDPPKAVINQLLEAGYWPFPTVVGIINAPTMRKDGSLLTEQGYDKATQLWYKSSGDVQLPAIPQHPSRAEAVAALATLDGLLKGFPFADDVARSVALAGMMTTALRGALPMAVPIFLVNAPEARTGKTYLVCVITVLATGHIPPSTAGASEERPDEIEKRIETAALSGRPIMHLNNLPNGMVLDSARLSELCTEGYVTIRMLGRHEEGLCDCRATTVFLNGNNVRVAGDLVLRTLECRLDAKSEEPEKRTFDFDPIAVVRKDRGAYLAAIFTIVRAFLAAGAPKPDVMHSVAGFEAWARFVQQPLIWLGMADPCGNITSMREMDIQSDELQKVHKVLRDIFKPGGKFTTAICSRKADEMRTNLFGKQEFKWPELRELMTVHGKINERSFGRLLARHRGRITDKGWHYQPAGIVDGSMAYMLVSPKGYVAPPPTQEPM